MSSPSHDPLATRSRRVVGRLSPDGGFGLVEAMIALVIIFGLILVLMRTLDSTTRVLVETRRTSSANTFAVELLERAQALEWDHIGLAVSTNGADCATEQVGCATYLAEFPELASDGAGGYTFDGEQMIFTNSDTFRPFLSFHEQLERDGTLFDRYIFVGSVDSDSDGDEDFRRVTAAVSWVGAGGFRNRILQAALITEYVRPSQPLIRTDVHFSAGAIDLSGFNEGGAVIAGTGWADAVATSREQVVLGVTLPEVDVTALSDFVSEGRALVSTSVLSLLRWAGADGSIGTADDDISRIDPTELALFSDDDVFTTPGTTDGPATAAIPGMVQSDVHPRDLVYREVGYLDSWSSSAQNTSMTGRADAVTGGSGADGLPFAEATYQGAGKTFLGTREYTNEAVRTLYGALTNESAESYDLDENGYDFVFFRGGSTGSSDPLEVAVTADRAQGGTDDTTTGSITVDSPDIALLYDEALAEEFPDFLGWVVIFLPDISMASGNVRAGEGATNLFLPTVGNVVVQTWDPATGSYVTHPAIAYAGFGSDCGSVLSATVIPVGTTAVPLTLTLTNTEAPALTYELVGSVTINPWCSTTTTEGSIVVESSWQTVGPMVSSTIDYRVTDGYPLLSSPLADPAPDPLTLFDFTLGVSANTLQVIAVYDEPAT